MNAYLITMVIAGAVFIMGAIMLNYNLYHMIFIDAKARGMKSPNLRGFFALSDGKGAGLLTYLLSRRKYTRRELTIDEKIDFTNYKKKAILSLLIFLCGAIPLIIAAFYYIGF
ncbi:hypothetical protein CL176_05620 [Suicoccus acidiformans]|uniref:DUF3899 domain-containing protein n=1 Tax=Suicoccus acidiformans TaxID=2036206 RepID=A0A347WKA5_9LACT|nr:hypothetical protein [Suicoccus acidiformans]AXY25512.1 hypothetical protein CL176_05620 [Suicoccus acidiformans]